MGKRKHITELYTKKQGGVPLNVIKLSIKGLAQNPVATRKSDAK